MKFNSRLYVNTHIKMNFLLTFLILSGVLPVLHLTTDLYINPYAGQD
jgi:hypothetical protein